jgi:hypothetical protein
MDAEEGTSLLEDYIMALGEGAPTALSILQTYDTALAPDVLLEELMLQTSLYMEALPSR